MALPGTFLSLQEEYAQLRGEYQNGSINGMNSDVQVLMKKNLNREIIELADLHPPLLNAEWHLRFQTAVTLDDGTNPTITGTKNLPYLYDTSSNLKERDIYRLLSNDTYRRRLTGIMGSGTSYNIANGLKAAATTADTWVAYKDVYPLPHDLGDVELVYFEDGEREITYLDSRIEFHKMSKRIHDSSEPRICCDNVFTNKFANYKFQETSVSISNGSQEITVADTQYYDIGDVITLTSGSTIDLHTLIGVTSTTIGKVYIDRPYNGSQSNATLECNPRKYTEYMSFWYYPNTEKDVIINGWLKPQDMVYATDVCILPVNLIPTIVIGALLRDKLGLEVLSQQWVMYYQKVKKRLTSKKKATLDDIEYPDGWDGVNPTGFQTSDYPHSAFQDYYDNF